MQEEGLEKVDTCVIRRHNKAAQYIVMRQILDLCEETVRIKGVWAVKRWRNKKIVDLLGSWEATAASEEEVGAESWNKLAYNYN